MLRLRHHAEVRTAAGPSSDPTADDYLVVVTTPDSWRDRFGWRALLAAVGYGYLVVLAILSLAVSRGLGPVRVLLLGLVVTSLALLRRPGWLGVAAMAATALVVTADAIYLGGMTGAFHPTSAAQFVSSAGAVVLLGVTVLAAASALQVPDAGARPDPAAQGAALSGATALVAVVALAVASGIAYDEPAPAATDVRVRALWHDCSPRTLRASPGPVAIYVRNQDGSRRVFEIAELGVVLTVPAHRAARTEFSAGPGSYTFVCDVAGRGRRTRGQLLVG